MVETYSALAPENDIERAIAAMALMRTADGKVAMLHSSASQWRHRFGLEITLTKGTLTLAGILSGSKSYGDETLTIARTTGDDRGDPEEETRRYDNDPSWADEVAEFADAVLGDTPIENGSSDDALKTMRLVYRIPRRFAEQICDNTTTVVLR